MELCIFCNKASKKKYNYLSLPVCKKCYFTLELNKLNDLQPPSDEYLKSLVADNEKVYIDLLNLYSTLQPRTLAPHLFGIFFVNLHDREMDDVFIISMIIAARSIWLFGNETKVNKTKLNQLDPNVIHTLHVLGNMVSISIMGNVATSYGDLNLEDETGMSIICNEIDVVIIEILQNLMENDDGTLDGYIIKTINLIKNSELFR